MTPPPTPYLGAPGPVPAVPGPLPVGRAVPMPVVIPWHKRRGAQIGMSAAAVGVIALSGLVMLLVLGSTLGTPALVLAAAAALLPLPVLVYAFVWLDRYEPEPWRYMAFAFAWGACVATAAAYFVNTLGDAVVKSIVGKNSTLASVLVAPPVEELAKAAPVFLLLILTLVGRRNIHGVVDGIVYAGMSAIGFAFTENVLYFGGQYLAASKNGTGRDGLVALFWIFVLRGVFSPFAHPLFTCITGIGVGIAVRTRRASVRVLAPLGGLLLAMTLHGVWNLFASSRDFSTIALGYVVIMLPAFAAMVTVAVWVRSREAQVITEVLPAYAAAGWLTPREILSLSFMRGRRMARWWAKTTIGPSGERAMRDYQFAATRLALLRDALTRGLTRPGTDFVEQERELLGALTAHRQIFLPYGLPPVAGLVPRKPRPYGPPH
ncbi:MAG: Membrane proteinase PrsW, cleaves anti-sigma factor RsiW, family [Actinomycetia bacterium]|nr:Membrane proteinase PrsW, cleaves anti-sigma factor RsiW, family [Actinomycetes bacterium]MDQ1657868.1 protease PrsW [Cryptosporangiaceae bacterium]